MKKLNILLLSVVATGLTFVSCTKEDDNATDNGNNTEVPTNLSLSGKWYFSKYTENNSVASKFTAGWGEQDTQCESVPDYIDFKNATTIEYGDADTDNTSDCTVSAIPMTYSTTATAFKVKNLAGAGLDVAFTVVKNTESDLHFKVTRQGVTYTYMLTKASN